MTRYLIVEPRASGHLLVYVRLLAEYAQAQGHVVSIALSPEAFASREMKRHLGGWEDAVIVAESAAMLSPRGIERLSHQQSSEVAVVPHGDEVAPKLALRGGYRGSGRIRLLVMRDPRWERPNGIRRWIRKLAKIWMLSAASLLPGIDLIWLREPQYAARSGELFAVDPFVGDGTWDEIHDEGARLRQNLSLDNEVFWFGMTGAITDRKNVPIVLEALAILKKKCEPRRIGFACVGPIESKTGVTASSIRAACERMEIECRVDDRLLSNFEMNGVVETLDAIVMAYSSHSPNSTLGKAWVLGARLVAAGPPSVQRFVRSLGGGFVSELNAAEIAYSMEQAMSARRPQSHHEDVSVNEFAAAVLGLAVESDDSSKQAAGRS